MKLYYLEKNIEDFNGWNFEWKMETKGDVKVRFSDNYTILHWIWKRISKILMDGILNGKWKRGRNRVGFKFSDNYTILYWIWKRISKTLIKLHEWNFEWKMDRVEKLDLMMEDREVCRIKLYYFTLNLERNTQYGSFKKRIIWRNRIKLNYFFKYFFFFKNIVRFLLDVIVLC